MAFVQKDIHPAPDSNSFRVILRRNNSGFKINFNLSNLSCGIKIIIRSVSIETLREYL